MAPEPRAAILLAATEAFARFGFKKASMEDIARLAGVGKGSIYLHFDSKEALFEAVLWRTHAEDMAELEGAVRRAGSVEAQARTFLSLKLRQMQLASRHPQGVSVDTLIELGAQATRLVPEVQKRDAAFLERILTQGVAEGVFSVDDPKAVALGAVEALMGLASKRMSVGPMPKHQPAVEAFFEVFLRGLLA
jgi:AcrR family transcriptional regulator